MNWLERLYCWFWFNVQSLWEKNPWARRPFTFIFHDFSHKCPAVYWTLHILGLGAFAWWINPWILLIAFIWYVNGHVTWGGHKVGEQEDPPYIEE